MPGKEIRSRRGKPLKVRKWSELEGLESKNYRIELLAGGDSAYIRHKENRKDRLYLTTHFFYINRHNPNDRSMETFLRDRYGFNLEIIRY